jgi:hypothetical protein
MYDIVITLVNHTHDDTPFKAVIFQKNIAGTLAEACVAWKVFITPFKGSVAFAVPINTTVAASDSYGIITPQLTAQNGNRFDMVSSPTGNQLRLSSKSASGSQVMEVYNELPIGSINAMVYRDNSLLAQETDFGPGQKAAFAFEPTLCISISTSTQIRSGDILDATITANPFFQFSLIGIRSADIVMTGGGTGTDATPYQFTLENVKLA